MKNILQTFLLIIFVIILWGCQFPLKNLPDNVIFNKSYVVAWPDTLYSTGIGIADSTIPIAARRVKAVRDASLKLQAYYSAVIYQQKISDQNDVSDIFSDGDHDDLKEYIKIYVMNFQKVETRHYSNGSVEIDGILLLDKLKIVLIDYFRWHLLPSMQIITNSSYE